MAVEPFECKQKLNKLLRTKTNIRIISADTFFPQKYIQHTTIPKLARVKLKKTHLTIVSLNQYILSKVNFLKLKIPCSEHYESILTLSKSVLHTPPVYI